MTSSASELGEAQRAFLERESHLARRVTATRQLLSSLSYPLDHQTARSLQAVSNSFVMPWASLLDWPLPEWVRQAYIREGASRIPFHREPFSDPAPKELFHDEIEWGEYLQEMDFSNGLAGIRDSDFEFRCNEWTELVELSPDEGIEVGDSVSLPVPLGRWPCSSIPLAEGMWLDRHLVELSEMGAILRKQGYDRLPSDDPHRLAWHRFFQGDSHWKEPRRADLAELSGARRQAGDLLATFSGRTLRIGDREHLHVEDYDRWEDRKVTGDILASRSTGVAILAWNRWVKANSSRGWPYLFEVPVRVIEHRQELKAGRDYIAIHDEFKLLKALNARQVAMTELSKLARGSTGEPSLLDELNDLQIRILRALKEKGPLTTNKLAAELDCSPRHLFSDRGVNGLMNRMPPLVINHKDGVGYRLTALARDAFEPRPVL